MCDSNPHPQSESATTTAIRNVPRFILSINAPLLTFVIVAATLKGGIVVNVPRWLDMDPDRSPIDRVGVPPMIQAKATRPGDFKDGDPVFEQACAFLAGLVGRRAGKRD